MKFSIVLPMYNVQDYLERCLLSLRKQTYQNFEVIIVDDYSSDKSLEIAKKYAAIDSRIRFFSHPNNMGTFEARKKGVIEASGDYLIFLDPDDEITIDTLEFFVKNINKEFDIVFYSVKILPKPKFFSSSVGKLTLEKEKSWNENIIRILNCKNLNKGTAGKAYNLNFIKHVYIKLNKLSLNEKIIFGEDKLFFLAALLFAKSALTVNDSVYIYHKNASSITNIQSNHIKFFKIQQLYLVRGLMLMLLSSSNSVFKNIIMEKIITNDIDFDILKEKLKNSNGFFNKTYIYIKIFYKKKDLKNFVKLFSFIVSFGFFNF